jgi:multiple sugar transport system permease protein
MMRPIPSAAVLFSLVFTFTDMTIVYILTADGPFDSTHRLPWPLLAGFRAVTCPPARPFRFFSFHCSIILADFMLRVARRSEVN